MWNIVAISTTTLARVQRWSTPTRLRLANWGIRAARIVNSGRSNVVVAASTVCEGLRAAGLDPAPDCVATTCAQLLRSQAEALPAARITSWPKPPSNSARPAWRMSPGGYGNARSRSFAPRSASSSTSPAASYHAGNEVTPAKNPRQNVKNFDGGQRVRLNADLGPRPLFGLTAARLRRAPPGRVSAQGRKPDRHCCVE